MKTTQSISVFLSSLAIAAFLQSCNPNSPTAVQPTPPPTTTPTPTPTPEATNTPTPTPEATNTPTPTPEATNTPTPTPEATNTPTPTPDNPETSAYWTDTSKLLAGIKVKDDSKLASVQKTQAWINHQKFFNTAWSKLENQQLSKVRKWSATELKTINASNPKLFYPFSGPDFLYAYSLFPKASEYILVGLEPVGTVPNLAEITPQQQVLKLQEIDASLYAILQFSFFRTNDMKVDLAQQGVLPLLLVFLARTNNNIVNVEYIGVDKEANIQKLEPNKGMVPGVKITFIPEGASDRRILYYFSTDLSDSGLAKTPNFIEFIKKIDKPVSYLKAASYLMHYTYFSTIRNLILSQSQAVLQDDSGMPVRYFDRNKWDLKFFGTYTAPIQLFSNMYQQDLRKIYQNTKNIQPLTFGIGYKFGPNESNLMLATVRSQKSEVKSQK